jgi:tetratricopeptide (TPR) repeat protein
MQGQLDSALVYYQQALVIDSRLQMAERMATDFGSIGNVYQAQGQTDSALVYYQQALAINRRLQRSEGMGIAFLNMGFLFENRKNYIIAAAHFDSAYAMFSAMGSLNAEWARNAQLRIAMKQDPFWLGHYYLNNGKPEEALKIYRKVLQSNPDSLQGYMFIASVFLQTGPADSVVANCRRALAKNPNFAEALNNLAWHYALRNENLEEALMLSQRGLQLKPQEPYFWGTLAEVYYRLARFLDAKTANDKVRSYARDEELIKTIEERAQKIEAKLKERAKK